jgi:hypothetical protein
VIVTHHHLFRHLCPLVAVGFGIYLFHQHRRRCQQKMRRMEERQEKMLETLKEIRDELRAKKN